MARKVCLARCDDGLRSQILEDVHFEEVGVVVNGYQKFALGTTILRQEDIHRDQLERMDRDGVAQHWRIGLRRCELGTHSTLHHDVLYLCAHPWPEKVVPG